MHFYNGGMSKGHADHLAEPRRILLVLPSWVGDLVLATPAIEAIRRHFAGARLVGVLKRELREILSGSPWLDEQVYWESPAGRPAAKRGLLSIARQLRREPIDLAIIFPNSLRSALLCRLAGARRRLGYAREGRTPLLTDRLAPQRENGRFKPVPVLEYYNRLAERAGTPLPGRLPVLFTTAEEEARGEALLNRYGVPEGKPLVILNPGGQYGSAKCWMPDRYATVGDRLCERFGAEVFVNVGPQEGAIGEAVTRCMKAPAHNLADSGLGLGGLKALVRRSALMITNDTGPRHLAIAFGVPLVTVFGPTHTEWTRTCYEKERIVRVEVECGPCQKRVCPLDLRCMTRVSPEQVFKAAAEMISAHRERHTAADMSSATGS
jgi:heptosyltransferase-2